MADQVPPETSEELNEVDSAETPKSASGDSQDSGSSIATTETAPELPDRIRVHALAKLLGVKSKQVLAALTEVGAEAKSPQSSLNRDIAESVRDLLTGVTDPVAAPAATAPPATADDAAEVSVVAEAPVETETTVETETPVAVEPVVETPVVAEVVDTPTPVSNDMNLFSGPIRSDADAELPPIFVTPAVVHAPLFLQPDTAAVEETRRRRRTRVAATDKSDDQQSDTADAESSTAGSGKAASKSTADNSQADTTQADTSGSDSAGSDSADSRKSGRTVVDEGADQAPEATSDDSTDAADDDKNDGAQPKRRRRGRRGRGRGRGEQAGGDAEDDSDDSTDADEQAADSADAADSSGAAGSGSTDRSDADSDTTGADADDSDDSDGDDDSDDSGTGDGPNRRRRRRRRRKVTGDAATGDAAASEDDPPNTVVHEREPRNKPRVVRDEVQGITGSTRLEAKRQRRRDGRDAGRRRPPILTESEFLARREAVDRVMVVREKAFGDHPSATQVAVLEDDILVEHFVTNTSSGSMVGNVYVGRVQNVLPSMEAAFVDIGRGRNGVLYAGEVNWEAAGLGGNSRKIEQALKPGDQVLVQVSKDPVGHKGARLTTQISLAGRFLVYVPGGSSTGISRKLPDTERKRLKEILRDIVPNDAGVIIRTASEGVSEEELARDVERLQNQWRQIEEQAANAGKGNTQTLYEEPDLLVKVIRDLFNEDFAKIVIEGEKAWSTVETYIATVAPDLLPRVHRHDTNGGPDVFETYRIDEQLAKALDRKVWLPSGGTLVIDRTEAMTVVDVNTGKFTGAGGNLEETVTRNNLEAAEEIVRQMRLRDIGGMIVVDFIDMVLESNRDLVLRRLTEALGRDRTRHQVSEVTSLGLVQMTRKKLGTGLVEAFSTTCEHCHGRGILVHSYPVEMSTSSDDNGARSASRGDSTPRKRRGRERPAAETPADGASNGQSTVEVDPSIKRAHPVALAMAAHHGDHPADGAQAAEGAPADTTAVEVADGGDGTVAAAIDTTEAVVVDEVVAGGATTDEPTAAAVVEEQAVHTVEPERVDVPEPVSEQTPAADDEPKKKSWLRRRVSRPAAAPSGESTAGTVFVLPAAGSEPPARVVTSEPEPPPPPREPRRRRAAGRPAGPPVDVDA
ncbi:translation initiation factor IF-2 N-terminal domain-containing protein [Antrihabitans spumae]|uniref:Translation initiation factor IF-2 N-terminal domain-containing protein n=1 Tax=Antrihabitans spumae TaxID=3373370 RepID=A0ABW7K461_9NOCA